MKRNILYAWHKLMMILFLSLCDKSYAGIAVMNDKDLSEVDGQFSEITLESFYTANDTIRIFMDLHIALYGTIDSVKAGYYYRCAADMQTSMAQAGLSGFEGFYDVSAYNNGANFNFAKITSDFNTMAPQGPATFRPWGNGGFNANNPNGTLTANTSKYDWDIWIDNIKFGESPDKPNYINGLITRVEFDGDLTDKTPDHLKRMIIGTNDHQGNIRANYQRYTGIVNPMLLAHTAGRSAGSSNPYQWTTGSMQMVRDSYLQAIGIAIANVEDRDTGLWLIMNFSGSHISYEMVAGLPENAIDFSYTQGLKDIPLWDPDWSPGCGNGPLKDPYNTSTQINSHQHGPK